MKVKPMFMAEVLMGIIMGVVVFTLLMTLIGTASEWIRELAYVIDNPLTAEEVEAMREAREECLRSLEEKLERKLVLKDYLFSDC